MAGLYRGVSGLALGTGLWVGAAGLWNDATGLEDGGGGPSLNLTLTSALDPRITFTRASSGTYFNPSGVLSTAATDTARFDYNPATLAARGLLIEEARTNQIKYSEQIDNAIWLKNQSSISAGAAVAPDGTASADTIIPNTASNTHRVYQSGLSVLATGDARTFSMMIAASGYDRMLFETTASSGFGAKARLDTGVIYDAAGIFGNPAPTRTALTALNGGWSRVEVAGAFNVANNGLQPALYCYVVDAAGNTTYAGDGTSGVKFWGVQYETGAFATSYIPTVAASATREADIAAMTGSNFSAWWGTTAGTIAVQATSPASGTRIVWQADDGTANNRITIYTAGTTVMAEVVSGGVAQASLNLGTITAGTAFKVAMRYGNNDFSASLNGAACVTDTSGTVPTVDRCRLGSDTTGNYLCGTIPALLAYRYGLPDGSLRSLSTWA